MFIINFVNLPLHFDGFLAGYYINVDRWIISASLHTILLFYNFNSITEVFSVDSHKNKINVVKRTEKK